jgi:hypothetical protein
MPLSSFLVDLILRSKVEIVLPVVSESGSPSQLRPEVGYRRVGTVWAYSRAKRGRSLEREHDAPASISMREARLPLAILHYLRRLAGATPALAALAMVLGVLAIFFDGPTFRGEADFLLRLSFDLLGRRSSSFSPADAPSGT